MRFNIDPDLIGILNATITKPIYLVEMQFLDQLYFSSNESISVDGITYVSGDLSFTSADNWSQARIRLRATPERKQIALSPDWRDLPCKIYYIISVQYKQFWSEDYCVEDYGVQGTVISDRYLLLNGLLTAAYVDDLWIDLEVSHVAMQRRTSPNIKMSKPLCNHLPIAGSVRVWNGNLYTLDARWEI